MIIILFSALIRFFDRKITRHSCFEKSGSQEATEDRTLDSNLHRKKLSLEEVFSVSLFNQHYLSCTI